MDSRRAVRVPNPFLYRTSVPALPVHALRNRRTRSRTHAPLHRRAAEVTRGEPARYYSIQQRVTSPTYADTLAAPRSVRSYEARLSTLSSVTPPFRQLTRSSVRCDHNTLRRNLHSPSCSAHVEGRSDTRRVPYLARTPTPPGTPAPPPNGSTHHDIEPARDGLTHGARPLCTSEATAQRETSIGGTRPQLNLRGLARPQALDARVRPPPAQQNRPPRRRTRIPARTHHNRLASSAKRYTVAPCRRPRRA